MKIKNKILTAIEIERMAAEGKCVAHYEGKVIFVKGVAPGDVVDLRIIRKRKSYLEAIVERFHSYSTIRTEPVCQHFGTCGGCKWQHIPYAEQLAFKNQQVIDAIERIAKVPVGEFRDIVGSGSTEFYRNKLEFTFSNMRWLTREEIDAGSDLNRNALGFHIPGRFDKILDIDKCFLQDDPSNALRNWLREYGYAHELEFYDIRMQHGFLRNLIIRTTSTGEVMVLLQVAEDRPEQTHALLEALNKDFPGLTSVNYVVNTKKNETFNDLEIINYSGRAYIEEQMTDPKSGEVLKFRIGPKSFYQTNSGQAEVLYKIAYDMAGFTGEEIVYDLYTGTGTIANYIARSVKQVVGVEYVEAAVADARINSEENGLTNTSFFAGDMKDVLTDAFVQKHGQPEVIITDPPRAGMHDDVIQVLRNTKAKKIVYVSCNPATQARDIALLDDLYEVVTVQPVDMFPHTHHVENVLLMALKTD